MLVCVHPLGNHGQKRRNIKKRLARLNWRGVEERTYMKGRKSARGYIESQSNRNTARASVTCRTIALDEGNASVGTAFDYALPPPVDVGGRTPTRPQEFPEPAGEHPKEMD